MQINILPVSSRNQMKKFIRFPLSLYHDDPYYVPPLLWERKKFFSSANPLFNFTEVAYFLAQENTGKVLGRVTAHINRNHNHFTGEKTGFFGFFECINDIKVAEALMAAAEDWLRQKGMSSIRGPFNFSTNEECGFLAQGFDRLPMIMMPYTRPYYLDFMTHLQYTTAKDLLAYEYTIPGRIPEYLERFSRQVQRRTGVTVRTMDMNRFDEDVATAFQIYNSAWEKNWGFVPVTAAEFEYAARELRPIIDPSMVLFAQQNHQPVAFSFSLPDYNILLKKIRGRLFPTGFFHFLFGRRAIHQVRVALLGILRSHQRRGIDVLLYYHNFRNGLAKGYFKGEMSWVLNDNVLMKRALERMGAKVSKIYRIYEKPL